MTGYLFVLFLDVFQCVLFCLQASIRSVHIDHILLFASRLTHDQDSSFLVIPHLVKNNYINFAKLVTLGYFHFYIPPRCVCNGLNGALRFEPRTT